MRAPKLDFMVTPDVIETAIPKDSGHCMIADALKAAIPTARNVSVDLATIRFTDPKTGRRYIYLTPYPAQQALLDFDQGVPPEPFTVKTHAAQIIPPKPPKPPKPQPESAESGSTPTEGASEPKRRPPRRAELVPNPAGGGSVPVKVGGSAPGMTALATGYIGNGEAREKLRSGRRREFGLKVMGR